MNVLVVHSRYRSAAPSGENAVVDQEVAALRAHGVEVERFERHSDDIATWPLVKKAGLPARSVYDAGARRSLARHLAASRPDVVHVHNTFPMLSPAVLDACAEAGVPVVATVHNYMLLCASGGFFRDGRPCHECADGRVGPALRHGCYRASHLATVPMVTGLAVNRRRWRNLVSAFVFVSSAERDLLAGLGLPPERLFVRHHFVPRPTGSQVPREHAVACVGRLDEAKGIHVLMAAWTLFRETWPDSRLRLHIAGGGPLDGVVRDWALGRDDVCVHGLVTREAAADLIARSLAVVIPSLSEETFGLVAVEAMSAGVAPVVSTRGALPELVRDGVDGVHVRPADPVQLAAVLHDADRDPQRWRAMGLAGRGSYAEHFEASDSVAQLLDIYGFAMRHPVGVTS
jgi:glycosyltransferase involved in cell wall biosynthesis